MAALNMHGETEIELLTPPSSDFILLTVVNQSYLGFYWAPHFYVVLFNIARLRFNTFKTFTGSSPRLYAAPPYSNLRGSANCLLKFS